LKQFRCFDDARRQAAVDGQSIDPLHLAAMLEGPRPRMFGAPRIIDRGVIFDAARQALTPHQWIVAPEFGQEGEVQIAEQAFSAPAGGSILMAAAPLVSATTLAAVLGMAVKNAIALLDAFAGEKFVVEVTHRCRRRLFGLAALAPLRDATAPPRRPEPGRGPGRPPAIQEEAQIGRHIWMPARPDEEFPGLGFESLIPDVIAPPAGDQRSSRRRIEQAGRIWSPLSAPVARSREAAGSSRRGSRG
jgi:hypothetical protein